MPGSTSRPAGGEVLSSYTNLAPQAAPSSLVGGTHRYYSNPSVSSPCAMETFTNEAERGNMGSRGPDRLLRRPKPQPMLHHRP
ncbi:hypothetical protein V6N11_014273 [Hibiscus sabdariffa]|uniref:Uncharacterized protein n=1 Tax=Hibiscus sabdariffa TaxID=183260 RepID=A0ABR1ZBI6_9ROSI